MLIAINFFVNSNYKNSSNSFCCNQTHVDQSPGLPPIFGCASTIVNTIETENPNVSNNLPDVDAELDYNDLYSMPSDYYDDHNSINNLLCSKNKSNHLFMIHFNVRSLQKNIDKLSHYLTDFNRKPDVIAVSETKLKENMIYSNIELDGYQFIHRNSHTSAGGVGIYVKSSISYNLKPTINIDLSSVENLWIEIEINKKKLIVGVVYRHPVQTVEQIELFSRALTNIFHELNSKKSEFYVLGDFNIDLIKIKSNNRIKTYADDLIGSAVKCLINQPTRVSKNSKSLLDHIYSNNLNNQLMPGIAISDISDHYPVFALIPCVKHFKNNARQVWKRDMKNFKAEHFIEDLNQTLNASLSSFDSTIHNQFEQFINSFTSVINKHAPLKLATRKERKLKTKPWLSSSLLCSIKTKHKLYKSICKTYDETKYKNYKTYRNVLNRTIEKAKQKYYNELIIENKSNSAKIWKIVNELVNLKPSQQVDINQLNTKTGEVITNPATISENLNAYFANIGKKMAETIPEVDMDTNATAPTGIINSFFLTPTYPNEINNIIDSFKDSKATRYTDAETKFIKISKSVISPFLCKLINDCFSKGVYPNCLKIAEVIPIFKKGDRKEASNYRPISILSQFDKILEKLIYSRIINFIEKNELLCENQFGFRKNSSTIFAINSIYDKFINNIDQNLYTCCLFLDLSKAFDTVDHDILLDKLYRNFGIRGKPLDLLTSYLKNRYQYTNVRKFMSSYTKVSCGVPQGSCLGPLLFLLYINDISLISNFDTTLFADDTCLMMADNNLKNLEHKVQIELKKVNSWLCQNKLSLNFSKTNYMLINKQPLKTCHCNFKVALNDITINRVHTVKYLGLFIDDNLKWTSQINYLSTQLARCTGLFYRLRNFVSRETLCMLYYSLVYSRIQYGITAWATANKTSQEIIRVRLNKILRIILFRNLYTPTSQMYKELQVLKVEDIYQLELAKFMYQLHHSQLPKNFYHSFRKLNTIHQHETRLINSTTYYRPRINKLFSQKLFSHRGSKLWGNLESELKSMHWVSFKKAYKLKLINEY